MAGWTVTSGPSLCRLWRHVIPPPRNVNARVSIPTFVAASPSSAAEKLLMITINLDIKWCFIFGLQKNYRLPSKRECSKQSRYRNYWNKLPTYYSHSINCCLPSCYGNRPVCSVYFFSDPAGSCARDVCDCDLEFAACLRGQPVHNVFINYDRTQCKLSPPRLVVQDWLCTPINVIFCFLSFDHFHSKQTVVNNARLPFRWGIKITWNIFWHTRASQDLLKIYTSIHKILWCISCLNLASMG